MLGCIYAGGAFPAGVTFLPVVTPEPTAVEVSTGGGGYLYTARRRTQKEIDEERMRLGIIPRPALNAVRKIAKRVIAKAKADPLEYLEAHLEAQRRQLEQELSARNHEYQQRFMIALRIEIELMVQAQEDEDIINLLFEM